MTISNKIKKYVIAASDKKIEEFILYNFYHTPQYKKVKESRKYVLELQDTMHPITKSSKVIDLLTEYCSEPVYIKEIKDYQTVYQEIIINIIEWSFYETYDLMVKNNKKITEKTTDDIKDFIDEVKDHALKKLEDLEQTSLYDLVMNNLDILSGEFLQQSFDFLHVIFEDKKREERYDVLMQEFGLVEPLTARNLKVRAALNAYCATLSIEDIEAIDTHYPMPENMRDLRWLEGSIYESKTQIAEGVENLLESILGDTVETVNEEEDVLFKLVRPLAKEIFRLPGEKNVTVCAGDIQSNFDLDVYNRVLGDEHLKHIYLIESLYYGLKEHGSVLIKQTLKNHKVLYGAILHNKNYAGLTSEQLIEACEDNLEEGVDYKLWKISSNENFAKLVRG